MKILQINSSANVRSTGRIAEDLGKLLIKKGHQSYIAYGRASYQSTSELIKIGSKKDFFFHVLKSRLFDLHGFGSENATRLLINQIEKIVPDIIHLHNIHGYYLNVEVLFEFLKTKNLPVVWTFHDCWPFTGHCTYFDAVGCIKWKNECFQCPNLKAYPISWYVDNSKNNYYRKKSLFTNIRNLTIVTPSVWLAKHVEVSFLHKFPVKIINNGIDLNSFRPRKDDTIYEKYNLPKGKFILGVAGNWDKRKGLADFIKVRKMLPTSVNIVLVGLESNQISDLPDGIIGLKRTESTIEMARLYSAASVYVNPTYVDNFPTTNIEAIACGTPVITYNTGGSPEIINELTGMVVEKGNISALVDAILIVLQNGNTYYSSVCRERAEKKYNKDERYDEYINLYHNILKNGRKHIN